MVNVLHRLEAELSRPGRDGRRAVTAWAKRCPPLLAAGIREPAAVPGWVSERGSAASDALFRVLVEAAQAGDRWALTTLLVCLRPGLYALAGRIRRPIDEVVSEATVVVFEFPTARRRSVPGQLLLDTRFRFFYERQRRRETPLGDTRVLDDREAPGVLGVAAPAVEELSALVVRAWRQGLVAEDHARLVLETRLWGVSVGEAAARRGISPKAVYCRRLRTEARLRGVAS
jgi:hypothetical protein